MLIANFDQADRDADGVGDIGDGGADTNGDGVDDGVDNCPFDPNADQLGTDGLADVCDGDDDNDTLPGAEDSCPLDSTNSCSQGDDIDIAVTKSNPIDWLMSGVATVCDIKIDNDGGVDAASIRMQDSLPASLIDVAWTYAGFGAVCPETSAVEHICRSATLRFRRGCRAVASCCLPRHPDFTKCFGLDKHFLSLPVVRRSLFR